MFGFFETMEVDLPDKKNKKKYDRFFSPKINIFIFIIVALTIISFVLSLYLYILLNPSDGEIHLGNKDIKTEGNIFLLKDGSFIKVGENSTFYRDGGVEGTTDFEISKIDATEIKIGPSSSISRADGSGLLELNSGNNTFTVPDKTGNKYDMLTSNNNFEPYWSNPFSSPFLSVSAGPPSGINAEDPYRNKTTVLEGPSIPEEGISTTAQYDDFTENKYLQFSLPEATGSGNFYSFLMGRDAFYKIVSGNNDGTIMQGNVMSTNFLRETQNGISSYRVTLEQGISIINLRPVSLCNEDFSYHATGGLVGDKLTFVDSGPQGGVSQKVYTVYGSISGLGCSTSMLVNPFI